MKQFVGLTALVVRDYDEAIAFYTDKLGFELKGMEFARQPKTESYGTVAVCPNE